MKYIIQKAEEKGFDLSIFFSQRTLAANFSVRRWSIIQPNKSLRLFISMHEENNGIVDIDLYKLLFDPSLGFIEALVGDRLMCTDDDEEIKECVGAECHNEWEACTERSQDCAPYHKQQLVTMNALDDMVEYLRGIVLHDRS